MVEDSDNSTSSKPKFVVPISTSPPRVNIFCMNQEISSGDNEEEPPISPHGASTSSPLAKSPVPPSNPEKSPVKETSPKDTGMLPKSPSAKRRKFKGKGVTIAEDPIEPLMRKMVDMASHFIKIYNKAEELKFLFSAAKDFRVIRDKELKRAEDLEAKLRVTEEALEQAKQKAKTDAEEKENQATSLADREENIWKRLEVLNTYLSQLTGQSPMLDEDKKIDHLIDVVGTLEPNSVCGRNLLILSHCAFKGLHAEFFPTKIMPTDLNEIIAIFGADPSPLAVYGMIQSKSGAETSMALAMVHSEKVD